MDSTRTRIREHRRCPEYAEIFPTDQVDETGQFGNQTQRGSTQVRWFGQELSRAPDLGIGYSQDHRTQWAGDDWVGQDSCHPTGSQLMGRKRRAGDRLATRPNVDGEVHRTENRWGTPRKCALFGSDGPDSMSSGSDVVEAQDWGPPDDGYPVVAQSGLLYENDSLEEAWSPSRKLEDAVARLQKDITDYRKELRFSGVGPRNGRDLLRRQFPDIRGSLAGNNIDRCLRPLRARMAGMTSRQLYSYFLIWMEMLSMWPCWFRSPSRCYREFQ